LHAVFIIQQQVDSSLEGPHKKENIIIIPTQNKFFSKSHAPTSISNHFAQDMVGNGERH
jgi:hypothetical protein